MVEEGRQKDRMYLRLWQELCLYQYTQNKGKEGEQRSARLHMHGSAGLRAACKWRVSEARRSGGGEAAHKRSRIVS
jgi:hypothetical protein